MVKSIFSALGAMLVSVGLAFSQAPPPAKAPPPPTIYDFDEISPGNAREIGPNDYVLLEKEPHPTNMNDLRRAIGYPEKAIEAAIEGKVILRVLVSEEGEYVKHIIIKNPHPILTEAVTTKISMLDFEPGIQSGKPIKVWVTMPFDFVLFNETDIPDGKDH